MSAAEQGTVMVCEDTHKAALFDAAAHVDFDPPKQLHLKGIGLRQGFAPNLIPTVVVVVGVGVVEEEEAHGREQGL
jgi:hypothetical protein